MASTVTGVILSLSPGLGEQAVRTDWSWFIVVQAGSSAPVDGNELVRNEHVRYH
jgi:hypothetical protein